jgi:alkylation response protein AidB-like acyl-CoA dehydrogenase
VAKVEFGFIEEQQRFRQEVRNFCQNEPWGELEPEIVWFYSPSFYQKVAKKGWLGILFPKEYGGQGKDAIYEAIFTEEVSYSGAPLGLTLYSLTVHVFGSLILKCGTEQQRKEYLPRIIEGEIRAGQMYTEPEAGNDLASVKTRAVRQGNYYLVNGQKMFTTFVHHQNVYSILMARTDQDAPLEKGISLFILDNKTSGISYAPLLTTDGLRTNQVFLDDVKIPKENLIGEENKGWDYFMQTKAHYWHKGRPSGLGTYQRKFDSLTQYVRETQSNGHPLGENPAVRQKIAEMAIDLKVLRLLIYRVAWMLSKGLDALTFAAILKVLADDIQLRFDNNAMQILGLSGQLGGGASYAPISGIFEAAYVADVGRHVGDTYATAKNIVATYGLGLPELWS